MILALSRPDPKKNVMTLLKAYGESHHLQELANLVLHLISLLSFLVDYVTGSLFMCNRDKCFHSFF